MLYNFGGIGINVLKFISSASQEKKHKELKLVQGHKDSSKYKNLQEALGSTGGSKAQGTHGAPRYKNPWGVKQQQHDLLQEQGANGNNLNKA